MTDTAASQMLRIQSIGLHGRVEAVEQTSKRPNVVGKCQMVSCGVMVWCGNLVETPREKSSIECAVNLSYSANFFQNNEWRHLFGSPVNDPGRPKNDPAARPDKNLVTRVIIFRVIFFVTRAMARVLLTRATALITNNYKSFFFCDMDVQRRKAAKIFACFLWGRKRAENIRTIMKLGTWVGKIPTMRYTDGARPRD